MLARIHRPALPHLASALAVLLAIALTQATLPTPVFAATTLAARCDAVNLRTRPSTSATIKVRIKAGTRVVATARVSGTRWRTRCAGRSARGSSWYRITSINGRSVSRLYGVKYVYGATSLFRAVTVAPAPTPTPHPEADAHARAHAHARPHAIAHAHACPGAHAGPDADALADRLGLHRGHRRQPLAGSDRLADRRRHRAQVRVPQGVR